MSVATRRFVLALAALALMAGEAQAKATAAQSCAKAKVPAAGKAASCRLTTAGVFLASAGGAADIEKRDAGYAKCQSKMDDAYAKADAKYGTACAVPGNATTIDALTAVYSDEVVRLNQPPTQSCAKAKVSAAGKAASCRLTAAGVFLASAGETADIEKRDAGYAKCQSKMDDAYAKADAKYGTACAVLGNATTIDHLTAVYSDDVVRLTVCGDGYSSDGQTCTDIDECATDNGGCGSGANCTNTTGSHTCECLPGYSDVDGECLDIDECSLNTDDCDAKATCTNIAGTYTCACKAGYSGDGRSCTALSAGGLWTRATTGGQTVQFSVIPAGTYQMGAPSSDTESSQNEKPVHTVNITRPFLLSRHEVTQELYVSLTGTNPSSNSGNTSAPVERVSWFDAVSFCNKLSDDEGLSRAYDASNIMTLASPGYRLPTEAEWEYAARAGTTGSRYGTIGDIAWYAVNATSTKTVGGKTANAWNLYDMLGNVAEWANDNYVTYPSATVTDPTTATVTTNSVARGGGYTRASSYIRATQRFPYERTATSAELGFRCARTIE
jgi:formylglycine-generating enzyme required for sulfatase activity